MLSEIKNCRHHLSKEKKHFFIWPRTQEERLSSQGKALPPHLRGLFLELYELAVSRKRKPHLFLKKEEKISVGQERKENRHL